MITTATKTRITAHTGSTKNGAYKVITGELVGYEQKNLNATHYVLLTVIRDAEGNEYKVAPSRIISSEMVADQIETETDPFATETTAPESVMQGDYVLLNGIAQKVNSKPFQTYTDFSGQVVYGPWHMVIGGRIRYIESTVEVLKDPQAARQAEREEMDRKAAEKAAERKAARANRLF